MGNARELDRYVNRGPAELSSSFGEMGLADRKELSRGAWREG